MTAITTTATSSGLSPETLTAAIKQEHAAVNMAAQSALQHALEAGRLLAEAKATIAHGSWESFVKGSCGIAPRTASLYQRLHRHRDRLLNRQHVAELSVRQAARLLEQPKAKAETVAPLPAVAVEQGDDLRLQVPAWYRVGHRHFGSHPSEWCFEVWPTPAGDQWAHYYICSPPSGYPGDEGGGSLVGPKRGIRVDRILRSMNLQTVNGMPALDDDGWQIFASHCDEDDVGDPIASRFKHYNTLLFADDDDYRRRGLGIDPQRNARARA
jgi:hypothetical protein